MFSTVKNAWRIPEIRKKILFTLFIILIYRIGNFIPVPFMDASAIAKIWEVQTGLNSAIGHLNLMSGGSLTTGSLFALGISPHITSSIVMQLLTIAIPYLENLSKEGPEGQKRIAVITRWVTLALALLQSIAYFVMLGNISGQQGSPLIMRTFENPAATAFVTVSIILSYTAGAMLTVWLGERIDVHGIGNGISILLFTGIISGAPSSIMNLFNSFLSGGSNYIAVPLIAILFLAIIVAIIFMTHAERRIRVQYAKRVVGRKMVGGQASYMPIKVMMSGVMPVIFAGSILSLPTMIKTFFVRNTEGTLFKVLSWFNNDTIAYIILYVLLIIAFNSFYIAITYDPIEMANNLRKNNGTIPGIRPGEPTAAFISRVINRITIVGAIFLAILAILPIIGAKLTGLQIAMGGTSVIIVVGVALDTVKQLESMMMMRHYKGFLE